MERGGKPVKVVAGMGYTLFCAHMDLGIGKDDSDLLAAPRSYGRVGRMHQSAGMKVSPGAEPL